MRVAPSRGALGPAAPPSLPRPCPSMDWDELGPAQSRPKRGDPALKGARTARGEPPCGEGVPQSKGQGCRVGKISKIPQNH